MIEKILERARAELFNLTFHKSERCKGFNDGIHTVMKIIQEESKNDGWIPCSERMPDTDANRKYLVCGERGGIYIAEFVCKAVSNNTSIGPFWMASGRYAPEPIAWKPLPAPYQKGE